MVRGLVIRRIFIWLDLCLIVLMFLTLGMIAKNMLLGAPASTGSGVNIDDSSLSAANNIAPLQERGLYDIIMSSGLFGDAGRYDPDTAPEVVETEPEVVSETEVETPLNLRLVGTLATSPTDRFASAIIEDKDQNNVTRSFGIDDAIVDNVFLKEVYARYVIILNERESPAQRQRLSMDDEKPVDGAMAQRPAPKPSVPQEDNNPITMNVNRQELLQEVYMNYADLVGKVRPRMVRDETGQISGVTADNIGDIPIAGKLGISNGDVLQSVNNERIDSEQKIMEMVQKYQNTQSIRIGIMRNGKPRTITYNME